jgi:hypothetical protein
VGLKDVDSVDIVTKAMPGDDCKLVLFAVDDGNIADEMLRYELLVAKLTAYANYVVSAEFRSTYPEIALNDVLVRVLCKKPASAAMSNVQSVGIKGDAKGRLRVVFADYDGFVAALKQA